LLLISSVALLAPELRLLRSARATVASVAAGSQILTARESWEEEAEKRLTMIRLF
jgi:hypothetical protein